MSTWPILGVLMVVGLGLVRPALGDEWKDEFWDGPCQVKVEASATSTRKRSRATAIIDQPCRSAYRIAPRKNTGFPLSSHVSVTSIQYLAWTNAGSSTERMGASTEYSSVSIMHYLRRSE
jgi:hypothetical protein